MVDVVARAIGASAEKQSGEIGGKADKVSGAIAGDFAALNSSGNLVDSGYSADDFSLSTDIITDTTSTNYTFDMENAIYTEVRLLANDITAISFTLPQTIDEKYISGLSFGTGATAPQISYADTGAINWVGTDCSLSGTLSIFAPLANKQYDIVFYYNGKQIIGVVNGYVPATGN